MALFRATGDNMMAANTLFNMAQCDRLLGNAGKALEHYREYLIESERQNPGYPAPHREEVQRRIEELTTILARPVHRPTASLPGDKPSRGNPDLVASPLAARSQPVPRKPVYKRWWFWAALGAVVAGATAVTIVAVQPRSAQLAPGSLGEVQLP